MKRFVVPLLMISLLCMIAFNAFAFPRRHQQQMKIPSTPPPSALSNHHIEQPPQILHPIRPVAEMPPKYFGLIVAVSKEGWYAIDPLFETNDPPAQYCGYVPVVKGKPGLKLGDGVFVGYDSNWDPIVVAESVHHHEREYMAPNMGPRRRNNMKEEQVLPAPPPAP